MLLKEFLNVSGAPAASIAAAGSTVADGTAVPVSTTFVEVTGADGTKGVVLATGHDAGDNVIVYSSVITVALKIYAPSGGQINEAGANAAFSAVARKPVLLKCLDATSGAQRWVALQGA